MTEKAPRRSAQQIAKDALKASKATQEKAKKRLERAKEEVTAAETALAAAERDVTYKQQHPALQPEPEADSDQGTLV